MKALYLPGPSYYSPQVKEQAGWWGILELQRQAIEIAGFEVLTPEINTDFVDNSSSFAKTASSSLLGAIHLVKGKFDLVVGAPSYSHHAVFMGVVPSITYVWNNADWYRDMMLIPEYKAIGEAYRTQPINNVMNELSLNLCNHVIACSDFVKHTHARVVPPEKISVARWSVDWEKFRPGEKNKRFTVLFIGGDPVRKGLVYLVKAFAALANPNMDLWVMGCRVDDYPQVRSFGMVPYAEMPGLIRKCHVLVLPTLEDGIGVCVQEAMASGVVPIATEDPSEDFEHGASGFRVPYRDWESIRDYLQQLYADQELLAKMAEAAVLKAKSRHWNDFRSEFAAAISRAYEKARPG